MINNTKNKITNFLNTLISDNDNVSSTRLVGLISLLVFFVVIFLAVKNNIQPELLKVVLEYLFYIIAVSLFSKTIKDIVKLIRAKNNSPM